MATSIDRQVTAMIIGIPDRLTFTIPRPHLRTMFALLLLSALSGAAGIEPASGAGANGPAETLLFRLAQAASPEVTFWESVRDSDDPAEIEAYLTAYPNGQFAPLARIRLDKLKQSAVPAPEKAESAAKASKEGTLGRQTLSVKVGENAGSKRGVLGVRISELTDELAKGFGLPNARGAFVTEVLANSAAALAAIKPLDVLVEFDGREIVKMRELPQMVGATPPGTEVKIVIWRLAKSFTELADRLRARSEKDDAGAANTLGWLYAVGAGTTKNDTEAVRWYQKGADQGNAEAMYRLATAYANGQGVSKDETEAVNWYRKSAEKNDANAIAALGSMHETGRGVAKDAAEAVRLYRRAADLGHSGAMFQLGVLYANGRGVPQDDAEAVIWYRRAAEDDNPDAMANLGLMYESGRGVFNDDAQAVRLYRKAAERGQIASMHFLANMYANGRGVAKDDAAAVSWYRQAANLGYANAMAALGWMCQNGRGIAQDDAEAIRWYRKAAELSQNAAMHQLGWMYANGRGVTKDLAQAATWYRKAADLGNADAMYSLGAAYELGNGVSKDPSAAADWVFKAIKAHDAFAVKEMTTNVDAWSEEFRRGLQRRMKEFGVYDGEIDGSFGPSTKAAVEALSKK